MQIAWRAALAATVVLVAATARAEEAPSHWARDSGEQTIGDGAGSGTSLLAGMKPPTGKRGAALRVRTLRLDALAPEEMIDPPPTSVGPGGHPLKCRRTGVVREERILASPPRLDRSRESVFLPDGRVVWSCEVEADGAEALRLDVRATGLDPAAEFVVYDAEEPGESYALRMVQEPTTGTWGGIAPTVFGSRVRLEVAFPDSAAARAARIRVERVVHVYDAEGDGPVEPFRAGTCHNKVACGVYSGGVAWSVARLSFLSGGSSYLCSGALIADLDSTGDLPYMLTAYHCISTASEASTLECYWDYKEPCGSGAGPSLGSVPRTSQAVILATAAGTDATLLRLVGTIPSNRYYLGWTTSTPAVNASVGCAHHPGGDFMKASFGRVTSVGPSEHFVQWTSGVTEGGSSGSPLLNSSEQIIGQLWAGYSSCSVPLGIDCYGRFDYSYPSFSTWLGRGDGSPAPPVFEPPPFVPPVPAPVAPAPTDLVASVEADGIRLRWRESSSDFFSVEVRRKDGGASYAPVGTVPPGTLEWLDESPRGGWVHTYVLRALNAWGPSKESNNVNGTAAATAVFDIDSASMRDDVAPRRDVAAVRFTLLTEETPVVFDPALHGIRVQMGQSGAPVDVNLPAATPGWKVTKKKAVWKSAKGAFPKVSVTVVRATGETSLSVKSFDFLRSPTNSSHVLATVGEASAEFTGVWQVRSDGTLEIR